MCINILLHHNKFNTVEARIEKAETERSTCICLNLGVLRFTLWILFFYFMLPVEFFWLRQQRVYDSETCFNLLIFDALLVFILY